MATTTTQVKLKKEHTAQSVPMIDIGISEEHRQQIAEALARFLADTYALYLKTHGFHWNVTGNLFRQLHDMFEEQYRELAEAVDVIAERIRALGFLAPGSYRELTSLTSIEDAKPDLSAEEMIRELVDGHEAVIRTARAAMPLVEEAHDEATLDILVERLRTHEKTAWMLRSLLDKR